MFKRSQFYLLAALTAGMPYAEGADLKLLCTGSAGGQTITKVVALDYLNLLADGHQATFAEDLIKWSTVERDLSSDRMVIHRHELNRLAGTYRSYQDGALYSVLPPVYKCGKAPQPKF